ncbi:unnamed protein product [Periconia digitata]|uniref:Uncharacterized protein n=1 Tax=Periconia digitata TaxID=1303443 RepID=A0A9W4U464_9PLEO|nr:unnamed protein product [Periconia digitata]
MMHTVIPVTIGWSSIRPLASLALSNVSKHSSHSLVIVNVRRPVTHCRTVILHTGTRQPYARASPFTARFPFLPQTQIIRVRLPHTRSNSSVAAALSVCWQCLICMSKSCISSCSGMITFWGVDRALRYVRRPWGTVAACFSVVTWRL